MTIVITTPSGNIGSAVTSHLLDNGEKPVLIARDPSKVKKFTDKGAVVKTGSHSDADFLIEASKNADALFVLTPPDFKMTDIRGHYRTYAEAAAKAAKVNKIPYVVHLSSVGADLESGNGPVAGLHVAEQVLNASDIPNLVHLRAGYFMENTLAQIPSILQAKSLFTNLQKDTKIPMIATRDIGERAALLLKNRDFDGRRVMELQGAAEITYEEVASILSRVLDLNLNHVTISSAQLVAAYVGAGIGQVVAESFAELADSLSLGKIRFFEDRSKLNTTPTTYTQFAEQVFKPAFTAAQKGA
jgi:uncharacterized protein YbjT (DUF2867 family)